MAYGSPHTETIPTVGATLGTAYATMVNAVLTEMRTTLDAKVTPTNLLINADIAVRNGATRYGLTDLHRLSLYQQPSLISAATYPAALYSSSAGELYFNDAAGNQVKITNGGSLNGTPGSITGTGYGATGVEINWDSGAGDYHLYSGAGTYADVNVSAVQLYDGSSNYLRMSVGAMAADYTLAYPVAVAAANSIVAASTSGSTTTLAFTPTPTVTSLTTTGAIVAGTTLTTTSGGVASGDGLSTVGSATIGTNLVVTQAATVGTTLGVTGLITATAGLTAAANQHITVSGNGEYKHGSLQRMIPAAAYVNVSGTLVYDALSNWGGTATAAVDIPLVMEVGERITAINVSVNDASGGAVTATLYSHNISTGAIASVVSDTSTGTGWQLITLSSADGAGMPTTVTSGAAYFVRVLTDHIDDRVGACAVTYDR